MYTEAYKLIQKLLKEFVKLILWSNIRARKPLASRLISSKC